MSLELPKDLDTVVHYFSRLPGVGEKTALRQSLNLTNWRDEDLVEFAESLAKLARLKRCNKCNVFSETDVCSLCSSEARKSVAKLCVVESLTDFMAIENSQYFEGVYHILGGVLNPLLGIGPDELKIDSLVARVNNDKVLNVILAVNPSVEGDATCSYIKHRMPDTIKVERLGFGIPMGGSLEYLDALTITKALENRKSL